MAGYELAPCDMESREPVFCVQQGFQGLQAMPAFALPLGWKTRCKPTYLFMPIPISILYIYRPRSIDIYIDLLVNLDRNVIPYTQPVDLLMSFGGL